MRRSPALALTAVAVLLSCPTFAADGPAPEAPQAYDLSEVAGADRLPVGNTARTLLARNGFVVTDKQFKQIFEAYIEADASEGLPKFITTDSAWHTYHVLLEEGVKALEEAQAGRLKTFSEKLSVAASEQIKSGDPQWEQTAEFAFTALALQDPAACKADGPRQTAHALRPGTEPVEVPIGFPLSPQRFRAASFYRRSPELSAYFIARQWYATVVFRLENAEETALAVKLSLLIDGDEELRTLWRQLSEPYDALLAPAEDGTVAAYAAAAKQVLGERGPEAVAENIEAIQRALDERLPAPRVNDQLLDPDQYERFPQEIKGFRLLPPRRVPSAVCFQETVDPKIRGRMFPSGLDFLAACDPLASPAAQRALEAAAGEAAGAIAAVDCGALPDSLHGEALRLLAKLQEPRPEQAPAALRTDAWHDKQLWTQLGAWAEQRHTWALHTKLTIHYLGMTMEPVGMVSPYPEFFADLAGLSRATSDALTPRADEAPDFRAVAQELLEHIEVSSAARKMLESGEELTGPQRMFLSFAVFKVQRVEEFAKRYIGRHDIEISDEEDAEAFLAGIKAMAQEVAESGEVAEEAAELLRMFAHPFGEAAGLLVDFAEVCDLLAAIARKHLDGEPLDDDDEEFIQGYGTILAGFHFYRGNSWLTPRDDFGIITPVFASPILEETLYAGVARPQALYVIAPAGDGLQLFRGAVLSYREFRQPADQPLDDAAWRRIIAREQTPPPPPFIGSFFIPPGQQE